MPVIRNCCTGPRAIDADRLPDRVVLLRRGVRVDRDLVGRSPARCPRRASSGLKRWSPFGLTLNASPGAPPTEITLPSRPTSWAWSPIAARRVGDAGERAHLGSSEAGNDGGVLPFEPPIALLAR